MAKEFFKENIIRLRATKKWSQEKLAEEAGVSYHTVFRAEAGVIPRGPNIAKIARALGVSEAELFKDPNSVDTYKSDKSDLIVSIVARLPALNEDELGLVLDTIRNVRRLLDPDAVTKRTVIKHVVESKNRK